MRLRFPQSSRSLLDQVVAWAIAIVFLAALVIVTFF